MLFQFLKQSLKSKCNRKVKWFNIRLKKLSDRNIRDQTVTNHEKIIEKQRSLRK